MKPQRKLLKREYSLATIISLLIHAILFIFLFVNIGSVTVMNPGTQPHIAAPIQAVAVDSHVINKEIAQIKHQKRRKKAKELAYHHHLKQVAERQAKAARLHKKKLAHKQWLTQQRLHDRYVAKLKRLADIKAAVKAEKKRRAEKALAKTAAKEAQQLSAARARHVKRIVSRYTALILEAMEPHWQRPIGTDQLSCLLSIRLHANGKVINASLLESSGNPAFDQSAIAAVYKSAPLPVPDNYKIYRQNFYHFNLIAKASE